MPAPEIIIAASDVQEEEAAAALKKCGIKIYEKVVTISGASSNGIGALAVLNALLQISGYPSVTQFVNFWQTTTPLNQTKVLISASAILSGLLGNLISQQSMMRPVVKAPLIKGELLPVAYFQQERMITVNASKWYSLLLRWPLATASAGVIGFFVYDLMHTILPEAFAMPVSAGVAAFSGLGNFYRGIYACLNAQRVAKNFYGPGSWLEYFSNENGSGKLSIKQFLLLLSFTIVTIASAGNGLSIALAAKTVIAKNIEGILGEALGWTLGSLSALTEILYWGSQALEAYAIFIDYIATKLEQARENRPIWDTISLAANLKTFSLLLIYLFSRFAISAVGFSGDIYLSAQSIHELTANFFNSINIHDICSLLFAVVVGAVICPTYELNLQRFLEGKDIGAPVERLLKFGSQLGPLVTPAAVTLVSALTPGAFTEVFNGVRLVASSIGIGVIIGPWMVAAFCLITGMLLYGFFLGASSGVHYVYDRCTRSPEKERLNPHP